MNTIKDLLNKYGLPVVFFAIGGVVVYGTSNLYTRLQKVRHLESIQKSVSYHEQAEKINDYYFTIGEKTRVATIRATLVAIDRHLPKYFPEGPYTRKDFIALAMAESGFDQYLVGKYKEFGIFQLLPESCKWADVHKNQFDIEVNTEMAMFILQKKFEERKDYKKAIIAYNGYVVKDGKVSEVYWKRFLKFRNKLDDLFPEPTVK